MSNHDKDLASFDEQGRNLFVWGFWIAFGAVVFFFFFAILTHIFYLCAFFHRRERLALSIVYRRMSIAAAATPHGQQTVVVRRRRLPVPGLESSVVAALPKMSYEKTEENKECAVCLSGLEKGEMVRVLPPPCMHSFHVKCIDEWLRSHSTCPVCRCGVGPQESTRTAAKSAASSNTYTSAGSPS